MSKLDVRIDPAHHRTLDEMQHESWHIAEEHGWHQPQAQEGVVRDLSISERLALVHSEVSEALEEVRDGKPVIYFYDREPADDAIELARTGEKPEGLAIELADVLIRVFDLCEHLGISLEYAYAVKTAYNEGRPFRHGGKAL